MKFVTTGHQMLAPSTVRLQSQKNLEGYEFRPVSGPWSFFRRMRILAQGQIIEDIDNYNRTHEMMNIMTSRYNRDNDDIGGFGYRYDDENTYGTTTTTTYSGVAASGNRVLSFKPLSGLFKQNKWLPIRYMPITIELELVNSATDCLVLTADAGTFQNSSHTTQNTSETWNITNAVLKCDVCTLDNAVDNKIADHLLSGKPLPIHYQTFITQYQTTTSYNINISLNRAVSQLAALFVSFNYTDATFRSNNLFLQDFNTFYHPMAGTAAITSTSYDSTLELEYEFAIGSKKFPEYNLKSQGETFSQLEKTIKDVYFNDYNSTSIRPREYISDKHIIGINTSKV